MVKYWHYILDKLLSIQMINSHLFIILNILTNISRRELVISFWSSWKTKIKMKCTGQLIQLHVDSWKLTLNELESQFVNTHVYMDCKGFCFFLLPYQYQIIIIIFIFCSVFLLLVSFLSLLFNVFCTCGVLILEWALFATIVFHKIKVYMWTPNTCEYILMITHKNEWSIIRRIDWVFACTIQ